MAARLVNDMGHLTWHGLGDTPAKVVSKVEEDFVINVSRPMGPHVNGYMRDYFRSVPNAHVQVDGYEFDLSNATFDPEVVRRWTDNKVQWDEVKWKYSYDFGPSVSRPRGPNVVVINY